jgi:ribosomal protein L7/L12
MQNHYAIAVAIGSYDENKVKAMTVIAGSREEAIGKAIFKMTDNLMYFPTITAIDVVMFSSDHFFEEAKAELLRNGGKKLTTIKHIRDMSKGPGFEKLMLKEAKEITEKAMEDLGYNV